jgi:hypothetical protein
VRPARPQAGAAWRTKQSLLATNHALKSPSRRAGDQSDEKNVIVRGALLSFMVAPQQRCHHVALCQFCAFLPARRVGPIFQSRLIVSEAETFSCDHSCTRGSLCAAFAIALCIRSKLDPVRFPRAGHHAISLAVSASLRARGVMAGRIAGGSPMAKGEPRCGVEPATGSFRRAGRLS